MRHLWSGFHPKRKFVAPQTNSHPQQTIQMRSVPLRFEEKGRFDQPSLDALLRKAIQMHKMQPSLQAEVIVARSSQINTSFERGGNSRHNSTRFSTSDWV